VLQANRRWATGWQAGSEALAEIETDADSTETPDAWADLVTEEVTVGEARDAD
jgi:hypothetical protein